MEAHFLNMNLLYIKNPLSLELPLQIRQTELDNGTKTKDNKFVSGTTLFCLNIAILIAKILKRGRV